MKYKSEQWGERCRALLSERGITMEEFADYIGVVQSTFSKRINGRRGARLWHIEQMATALTELKPDSPVFPGHLAFGYPSIGELTSTMAEVGRALEKAAQYPRPSESAKSVQLPRLRPTRLANRKAIAVKAAPAPLKKPKGSSA
jgi:transcriptional regulator with XRE-family HTH domain